MSPPGPVPVVMEPELRNPATWFGPVGAKCGSLLYIDCSGDSPDQIPEAALEIARRYGECLISDSLDAARGHRNYLYFDELIGRARVQLRAGMVSRSTINIVSIARFHLTPREETDAKWDTPQPPSQPAAPDQRVGHHRGGAASREQRALRRIGEDLTQVDL